MDFERVASRRGNERREVGVVMREEEGIRDPGT